ncbi:hypothetical protein ACJZ2D_008416 [Fusarium nematophilum]
MRPIIHYTIILWLLLVPSAQLGTTTDLISSPSVRKLRPRRHSSMPRTSISGFLTSSNTLFTGFWIWRWVWFNKGTPHQIKASVKILAVESKYVCPGYVVGVSGATCPDGVPPAPDDMITIMGIGYGRTYDGRKGNTQYIRHERWR